MKELIFVRWYGPTRAGVYHCVYHCAYLAFL